MTARPQRPRSHQCPQPVRKELIRKQAGKCYYCRLPFGSVVSAGVSRRVTSVHYDHLIPYSYVGGINPIGNWVAACSICNLLKSGHMFTRLEDIIKFLDQRWEDKGYGLLWQPPVSSEIDPKGWAIKFATYLASLPPELAGGIERESA